MQVTSSKITGFETESQIIIFTELKLITLLHNSLKNYVSILDSQNCVTNNDSEKFRDNVQRIYLTYYQKIKFSKMNDENKLSL